MVKSITKRGRTNNGNAVVKSIPLDNIRTGETQSRVRIDDDTVKEYAELMSAGVELPPLVVFWDGTEYWLADGFHRYFAAQKREQEVCSGSDA